MSAVLGWIKANVYTVVFVLVMIAAPVAMWFVAGSMNAAVHEEVEARHAKMTKLDQYEKTSVSLSNPVPANEPVSATIAVNRQFLDRYQEVVQAIREDADRVREEILKINQKGRSVLLAELFPHPPAELRETLPRRMHQILIAAYEDLLESVGAGSPPPPDQLYEDLVVDKERLTTQSLKRSTDALTAEEQAWLTEQLSAARLSYYAEAAQNLKLYVTLESLSLPDESQIPPQAEGQAMSQMFEWQWQYWIVQDILAALAAANASYDSVVEAPVKRVERIMVLDSPGEASSTAAGGGGGGASAGAGFGAAGSPGRRQHGGGGGVAAPQGRGTPANPGAEVPLDYGVSFTGRTTNPLYDVRRVEVTLVVDSAKMPEVFNALSRENFMTVTNLRLKALDLFQEIRDGYFYGTAPVSRVTIEVETIWARKWTSEFMPDELKQALGIPVEASGES